MFIIIGWIVVTVCVLGGYMAMGGKLAPLWQPFELVIIGGAGVGAFITANPKLGKAGYAFKCALKGPSTPRTIIAGLLSLLTRFLSWLKPRACHRPISRDRRK